MKKIKVISNKNLPARPPLWSSMTAWLMLDRFDAPGWVYGVVGCLFVLLWIFYFCTWVTHEATELRELS